MAQAYDFNQATPGGIFEVGPFRVTPYEMTHIGVPSLGFRIEADGKVLAYTGDTGPCDNAVELATDADLFLCEATYQNDSELAYFHLSALQAAEHAPSGRRGAPGADAHHAEPRPRALAGGGGRGVHRRDRHGGARHGDRGRRVSRPDGRANDALRPVRAELGFQEWAAGSILFSMGKTRVLCAASVSDDPPRWLRGTGKGWVTAEYSMLPRVHERAVAPRGQQGPARRAHPGDPAPRRPCAPQRDRPAGDGRAHDHDRLRRAAGRRRHADGVDHRRLRRARARVARPRNVEHVLTRFGRRRERRHRRGRGAPGSVLRGGRGGRGRLQRRDDGRGRARRGAGHGRGRAVLARATSTRCSIWRVGHRAR